MDEGDRRVLREYLQAAQVSVAEALSALAADDLDMTAHHVGEGAQALRNAEGRMESMP